VEEVNVLDPIDLRNGSEAPKCGRIQNSIPIPLALSPLITPAAESRDKTLVSELA